MPAVVLGHGSAPSTRAMMGFWTNTALKSGVAVLVFDKRGTGASTGTFERFEVHERYLNTLCPWAGARPSVRQVHEADAHAMDYTGEAGFDLHPVLEKLTIPINRIGEYQRAGKRNFDIHVLPLADHDFVNVFTNERDDPGEAARAWLRKNGFVE